MTTEGDAVDREWIDRMLALYPSDHPFRARPTHNKVIHIGHGWYMRASRSAVAAIRLSDMELGDVAAPNRRCVIEHAIALKWLAKEGNPLARTIKNGHRYSVEKIDRALQKADWKSVDRSVVAEILADPNPTKDQKTADRFLNFMPRVVEYGEPNDVPPYLAETGRSHPSWESAAGYIDPDTLEFLNTEGERVSTVQACFVYLAVSLDAFHQFMDGDPWEAFFNDLSAYLETRYLVPGVEHSD